MLQTFRIIYRRYQTKTGVYGYLPRTKRKYKVPSDKLKSRAENSNFYRLVSAYREHGHKIATINPIALTIPENLAELNPSSYGLEPSHHVDYAGILNNEQRRDGTISEAIEFLQETYCGHVGAEISYLPTEEAEWFCEKLETDLEVSPEMKRRIMEELLKSQVFDHFLAAKFSSLKRYGAEGAEAMMAFFLKLLDSSRKTGVTDIVIGMPHRGRLNLLTGMLQLPPALIFRKIRGLPEFPESADAVGDVLSHLICSTDVNGVHVTMLRNPSHLEVVNPVSMGKTRAKQMTRGEGDYGDGSTEFGNRIINIQVHGDAGFAGQGVNQETVSLSNVPNFNVGGTLHLIVNNQIGFTTPADRGRSSRYASDLAKMISAPVLHVNGDHPEKVAQVTNIALQYQRTFRKDVFIDLNCYRQWGHNELDDPTFTNPAIYRIIRNRKTVPDMYSAKLVQEKIATNDEIEELKEEYYHKLNKDLKNEGYAPQKNYFLRQWSGFEQAGKNSTTWDTGMDPEVLRLIGTKSVSFPETFNIHSHLLKTHVKARLGRLAPGSEKIDWATAETMAIGSLLYQGFNVRISGQDVGRGTFSQRHAMLVDQESGDTYIPVNHVFDNQKGKLEIANSILSEEAVLGYEYGMSIENPNNLIIWEAQFGDFMNGAQIIIDTFIASGESKWMTCSGLVLLLPHGYDSAGPDHSSCRVERFLQLTDSKESEADGDNVNLQVANPTTPAQYFHLLRRQMVRKYRKPLVVVAPKTLLRLPDASSALEDFSPDTHFQNIIFESNAPAKINKLIFTTGKHFYNLERERKVRGLDNVAIVRVESLCPFPTHDLQSLIDQFKNVKEFVWSQEEPRNMGAWGFVKSRFENLVGVRLKYVGQNELPTTALIGQAGSRAQSKTVQDTF